MAAAKKTADPKKPAAAKKSTATKKTADAKKTEATKKPAASKKAEAAKKPEVAKKPAAAKKTETAKKADTAKKAEATKKPAASKKETPKEETPAKKAEATKKPAASKKETPAKKAETAKKPAASKKETPAKKPAASKKATVAKTPEEIAEMSVADRLKALHDLQIVDSEVDAIQILRGELPLEVQDLEDEVAGLETRINKHNADVGEMEDAVSRKNNEIVSALDLIKKYEEQQNNVRNNREFDSLSKEIEFQTLEIELAEKRKKEFGVQVDEKKKVIEESQGGLDERMADFQNKKSELDEIISDTKKEEEVLVKKRVDIKLLINDRLYTAYTKIRNNARNGLAVVTVERDACGGCFNKIPPQRQLDINARKKIIVCEYCGRILVDIDEVGIS